MGISRTRLTGFTYSAGGTVTGESQSEDACGNITTITTTTNRTARTVTVTTDHPDATNSSQTVTLNGLLQSSTDAGGVTTTFGYDTLGRRITVTDGRGNTTTTHYDAAGRVDWVKDGTPEQNQTTYVYYGSGADVGRLSSATNPAGKAMRYDYTARGEIAHVWGDVAQPTGYEYDDFGQRTRLHTYRSGDDAYWAAAAWPAGTSPGDVTEWAFDDSTGLLTAKTYADATHVDYTYTSTNRLYQRTWARGVVTTYSYDPGTGELTGVTYSNDPTNTPPVTYQYNRAGRLSHVTDATGARDFVYDPDTLELNWEKLPDAFFGTRDVVRLYDGPVGRLTALGIDTTGDGTIDAEYAAGYFYDAATGRMDRVTGPGLPAYGVKYGYRSGANLVEKIDYRTAEVESATIARTTRAFEPNRDLIDYVENQWLVGGATTVSKYNYTNDALGRRDEVVRTGSAFAAGHKDRWGYDARNELTTSLRYNDTTPGPGGTANPDHARDYGYAYDPIGNRETATYWVDDPPPGGSRTAGYTSNRLNQYSRATVVNAGEFVANRLIYDEDGNLSKTMLNADTNCDGSVNAFDIQCFVYAMEGQAAYEANCPGCDWYSADINGDGSVNAFDIQGFVDVMDGNDGPAPDTVGVLHRRYAWDAENRLVREEPDMANPGEGDTKSEYTYDYMSRRVEKKVYTRASGQWQLTLHRKFLYDGWNLILELDAAQSPPTVIRKYTWGLDLAGQNGAVGPVSNRSGTAIHGAGGIGGLLATHDVATGDDYAYLYDANGNVGQLIDLANAGATPAIVAAYEHDPYGGTIVQSGAYADANPFRFSTKYFDAETGFYCFGPQHYSARLGRGLNGSMAREADESNPYLYALNSPVGVDGSADEAQSAPPEGDSQKPASQPAGPKSKPCSGGKACTDCDGPNAKSTCDSIYDKNKGANGITNCRQRGKPNPCCCVCLENIRTRYGKYADMIAPCTDSHESAHYGGCGQLGPKQTECRGYAAGAKCIGDSAPGACGTDCACLKKAFEYAQNEKGGCDSHDCKSFPTENCHENAASAMWNIYDAAKKAGCKGKDAVPKPSVPRPGKSK